MPVVDKVESKAGRCKIGILVLGILVLGVGLYSYVESDWKKWKLYKDCSEYEKDGSYGIDKCPGISMEKYFIGIIVLTYILSVLNLAASLLVGYKSFLTKTVDLAYHGIAAILIMIGCITFLVSTEQIHHTGEWEIRGESAKMIRSGKLAAGIFAIFQSFLYGLTAFFIWLE